MTPRSWLIALQPLSLVLCVAFMILFGLAQLITFVRPSGFWIWSLVTLVMAIVFAQLTYLGRRK